MTETTCLTSPNPGDLTSTHGRFADRTVVNPALADPAGAEPTLPAPAAVRRLGDDAERRVLALSASPA